MNQAMTKNSTYTRIIIMNLQILFAGYLADHGKLYPALRIKIITG